MTVPWHQIPPGAVLHRLGSSPDGIDEADAAERLAHHGPNVFRASQPVSAWSIFVAQLRSVIVLLLVGAAGVALVSGDALDAGAIGAVLVLNLGIGFITDLRAHRAMEGLLALEVTRATVVREGQVREIDARGLVPGDVIRLEAGQSVPADARLLEAVELRTVEAALTGEPEPVDKDPDAAVAEDAPPSDRVTMVYKATSVVTGQGRAIVVATGMATEVGRIGELAGSVTGRRTPLERRLDALGRRLALVALAVAGAVAWISVRQGAPLAELIQTAIALAVAAVPEGLPVVATIAMAVGVRRMARRQALIRHLPAVETLGSATVICTDKTGTLTAGEMTATVIRLSDREVAVTGAGYDLSGEFREGDRLLDPATDPQLSLALRIGVLANTANLVEQEGQWQPRGDPTDAALLVAGAKGGCTRDRLQAGSPEVAQVPFSSERMLMATTWRQGEADLVSYVKGAPKRIVQLSDRMLTRDGVRDLSAADRSALLELNRDLAARGLRVLALATKRGMVAEEADVRGLTWVGFVGISDPPAQGVRETIGILRHAGIRTVMITGDQELTAGRVARDIGLLEPGEAVVDGTDFARLSDDQLQRMASRVAVYSRASPEAKLRIIAAHQRQGEIVAMLGDGVNDAAALRRADIGVVMGRRGTDLAKEAADLILEDDRFATVAAAVEEGRVIFANIRKFVFYLFSCNLAEILVLLGAALVSLPAPLLPLQILWLNLLTDTFPALALALESREPGIMDQPPRDPASGILPAPMLWSAIAYAGLISGATLVAYWWGAVPGGDTAKATTMAFMTLALTQIFHLGNARSASPVVTLPRVLANKYALLAVALAVGLQLLALYTGFLAEVLGLRPLAPRDWLVIAMLAAVPALVGQAAKAIRGGRA